MEKEKNSIATEERVKEAETAIRVERISKTFRIPREKISSLRGVFVNLFHSNGYEEFKALDNVSFEVKKGEFFGIIGRNGSGKSTLLKIMAGIFNPDKGKVKVEGLVSPFLELGIGFQQELSGRDNVYLNATVLGMTRQQINEKFEDIVRFSELERFVDQKIKNYSSGMQVRLAFSVAIHANRDILLMDEVLAVGDSNFQKKCINEFNRYKETGKTVILVSHDLATIQSYCDRVMLLRSGRLEIIADPKAAVEKYISQNISDEDIDKEAEKKNNRKSAEKEKQAVRIIGIEFLDNAGKAKNIFSAGEDISVRIHYQVRGKVEKPIFGVALYQDNIHITGPNTKTSNFSIGEISGKGFIDYIIVKNPFHSGIYSLTAAIHNWEENICYDFQNKAYSFQVSSSEENQYGLMELEHQWKKG